METSCNTVKRKKRRTRKCLDEIRKKSRRNYDVENEVQQEKFKKATKSVDSIKLVNNDYCTITSKRLTLKPTMFSKAIRSETITRPQLSSKLRADTNDDYTVPQATVILSSSRGSDDVGERLIDEEDNSSSEFIENPKEMEEISFHDDSDSNRENESPKSFIVFSPISQAIETEVIEESPRGEEVVASTSSASASASGVSSSRGGRGPHALYSQFMDEISQHLDRHAPNFIQPDVMRRTYKYLRNIYIEGCRRQPEQNMLQTFQSPHNIEELMSDKENFRMEAAATIVENPMQYIRMGVDMQQQHARAVRQLNDSPSSSPPLGQHSSPSHSSSHSPSPTPSYSPRSPCSSPTQLSIINDTPEYTFYPRKLNQ